MIGYLIRGAGSTLLSHHAEGLSDRRQVRIKERFNLYHFDLILSKRGIIMKTAFLTIILIMVPILSLAQTRDIRDRNDGGLKSSLFIPVDSERSHSQEGT